MFLEASERVRAKGRGREEGVKGRADVAGKVARAGERERQISWA